VHILSIAPIAWSTTDGSECERRECTARGVPACSSAGVTAVLAPMRLVSAVSAIERIDVSPSNRSCASRGVTPASARAEASTYE